MLTNKQIVQAAAVLLLSGAGRVGAAVTNSVGWTDSFESYVDGTLIAGTNGWSAEATEAGVVTTNPAIVAGLTHFAAGGHALPLPGAHSNILQAVAEVRNEVHSSTGSVAVLDFMAIANGMDAIPAGDELSQFAVCVISNGNLAIWHRNMTAGGSGVNQWMELAVSPGIVTGSWTRFTVVEDYSNHLFQIRVNNGLPLENAAGWKWSAGSLTRPGSWFYMVQTNNLMSRVRLGAESTNYFDDVMVTNRTVAWSGSGFTERSANDGQIDPACAVVATLQQDAFTGAVGDDLVAGGKVSIGGVPSNLVAVARRDSDTQVTISLSNAALHHESSDSVPGLTVQFADSAFTLGRAADVTGTTRSGIPVSFLDTPSLSYGHCAFVESAANDGSIDNSSPITITLTNGSFNGCVGDDFGANSAKVQFQNMPSGLSAQLLLQSATQLELVLLGKAASHAAANGLANLAMSFQDGAFMTVPASSVVHSATNLSVAFNDPAVLSYGTNVFSETAPNTGAVSGTTLTLSSKSFNATNGEDLVASGKVVPANVPSGLVLQVVLTDSQHATLSFGGQASNHAALDSIANLALVFGDLAFVGGNAAAVLNAGLASLGVAFSDPASLSPATTTFAEALANDGTIGNNIVISLLGDTFASGVLSPGVHYTVANVPAGLTLAVAGSGSQATLTLSGIASVHAAAATISNLRLTFLDAAFANVAASNILGHPIDFTVSFADPVSLAYSRAVFSELSGGTIDNRTPLSITLSGDTYGGSDGDEFVGRGWVTVANLPSGLSATLTRDSATQLSMRLNGRAAANAASNSVSNVSVTFLAAAFAHAVPGLVVGNPRNDVSVEFIDDTGFFNVVPYVEPFESYANGMLVSGTNGWTGRYADSGFVTNESSKTALLPAYLEWHTDYPVNGSHAQLLCVQDDLCTEVHSEANPLVYLDFMTIPVPMELPVDNDTNRQYAFYVSTNQQLVVWHRNTAGGTPINEWRALTNAGAISTSQWVRFSIAQDYASHRFQIRVNEGMPVVDPAGWDDAGTGHPGSWFGMVQGHDSMSRFRLSGLGPGYVDDLSVRTILLLGRGGSVFKLR